MASYYYSLVDILTVARIHPFYNPSIPHPPNFNAINEALDLNKQITKSSTGASQDFQLPLLHKHNLYETITRLLKDTSPSNFYRKDSYISITGGGSGKNVPMLFLTDRKENQNQRAAMSELIKRCGLVESHDWVLNLHPSGFLYRALDLTTETLEEAGANVLCAGHLMPHEKLLETCRKYSVNVLTGDSSHILNFAHYLASLPPGTPFGFQVNKIIYTCEPLSTSKRSYLSSIFGSNIQFSSMLASAETGPWAVAVFPSPVHRSDNDNDEDEKDHGVDFIYDTRAMKVEVLSLSSDTLSAEAIAKGTLPVETDWEQEGTKGHLVLTCLQRLRNPLVRYVSGDIGSVLPFPSSSMLHESHQFSGDEKGFLKILRLFGRDQRFSFKWLGEYHEFEKLGKILSTPKWGVLQWQVIVSNDEEWEGSDALELRVMRQQGVNSTLNRTTVNGATGFHDLDQIKTHALHIANGNNTNIISDADLKEELKPVFYLTDLNERLFTLRLLQDVEGFERAETSRKVVKFIDRRV